MNLKMLLGMACLSPLLVMSEERPILSRGETIALAGPEGYEHYQWQVSSDCQSFIDIPGATQKDLKMSVFAPGYYRVIAVSGSGVSVIPDTTDIAFQQVDYANETVLSAAHGYVETLEGAPGATGIRMFTGVVSGQNIHWNHTAFQGKTSGILVCKSGKRIRVARTISVGYQ